MSREITVRCQDCGVEVPLKRAKEALFETGRNAYHLMDLCSQCLDKHLKEAESVNDTKGFRQQVAVLIKLPGDRVPAISTS